MSIEAVKEIKLVVGGQDCETLSDLLEFARRYMEKTTPATRNEAHNLFDEFDKAQMDLFRVKLGEFFDALR